MKKIFRIKRKCQKLSLWFPSSAQDLSKIPQSVIIMPPSKGPWRSLLAKRAWFPHLQNQGKDGLHKMSHILWNTSCIWRACNKSAAIRRGHLELSLSEEISADGRHFLEVVPRLSPWCSPSPSTSAFAVYTQQEEKWWELRTGCWKQPKNTGAIVGL